MLLAPDCGKNQYSCSEAGDISAPPPKAEGFAYASFATLKCGNLKHLKKFIFPRPHREPSKKSAFVAFDRACGRVCQQKRAAQNRAAPPRKMFSRFIP